MDQEPVTNAPRIVVQLAATVGGTPMKWREDDDHWIIIMTDGRKYHFKKTDSKPRHEETVADVKPGVLETKQPETRKHKRSEA